MQLSAFILPNQPLTGSKNCVKVCMIFLNVFQKLTNILIRSLTGWHQMSLAKVMRPKDNLRGSINKIPSSSAVWITPRLLCSPEEGTSVDADLKLLKITHSSTLQNCHNLVHRDFDCLPLLQDTTLVHYNENIMLIWLTEQEVATTLDLSVRHPCEEM